VGASGQPQILCPTIFLRPDCFENQIEGWGIKTAIQVSHPASGMSAGARAAIPTLTSMMIMKRTLLALVATFALAVAGPLQAEVKRFEIDPVASSIKWHGAKVGADHFGKVRLKSGWLTLDGEQVTGGEFVADMTSITNDDLSKKSQNTRLVKHLLSDDFFNTKKFPESKVVIAQATAKGGGQHELTGLITIRNIAQPVTFTAHITVADDTLTGKGKLTFNRAKHEVKFNSGSFATRLGDKLIYDEVPLEVALVARAK